MHHRLPTGLSRFAPGPRRPLAPYTPLLLGMGLALLLALPARAQSPAPVYYQLIMERALFDGAPENVKDLIVDLEQRGTHWDAAYGVARDYNMAFHRGSVHNAVVTPQGMVMELGMSITADQWKPAGEGEYRLELQRGAAGTLTMAPAPLGTRLPRQWQAPDFGYYVLRSGWDDQAFIAQVFLKSQIINGWSGGNAGTYRLRGLGQDWATGPTDRVRKREQENVVWLPEEGLADGARAHLTHLHLDDHTLILSANLDEVYQRQGRNFYTRYGHIMRPAQGQDVPEPSGITGLRALAFDYSGSAGVPCLWVVVDRIDSTRDAKRLWLFQPPLQPKQTLAQVARVLEDGSFQVQPNPQGPSLRGRFAHPQPAAVQTQPLKYEYTKNWGNNRGTKETVQVNALSVPGADHFFFVGTVSAGEHPPMTIQGQGLDAVITIGRRTIRFDGQKIVLGTAPAR